MKTSRRNFLKQGVAAAALCLSWSDLCTLAARSANLAPRVKGKSPVLVVVQLGGGNDGLNTVVPYGNGSYYDLRPNLALQANSILPLNGQIGLNPNMSGLADLYKAGKLAIVQAVGYPNPNRSHFRSMEIWQTAEPSRIADRGWLGKYLDLAMTGKADAALLSAVNVDEMLPKSLSAEKVLVPSVNNVYDFRFKTDARYAQDRRLQVSTFDEIYRDFNLHRPNVDLLRKTGIEANEASDYLLKIVRSYKGSVAYPRNSFADGLKFISQMICGGVNSRVYNVSLNGFDTHANQLRTQNNLLKQLSEGLTAFQSDLEVHGVDQDVLVLVYSEFGRRVSENGGRGTDHGKAEPVFVIGSKVKGGLYGSAPDLLRLDDGDLRYKIDFRSIYATILDSWMGADSRQILAGNFESLPLL